VTELVHEWYQTAHQQGTTAAQRHVGRFMGKMAEVMRENHVQWEPDHQLFWRCILTLHAVQLRLAPDLDLFDAFRRTFDRIRPPPHRQVRAAWRDPRTWAGLSRALAAAGRVATETAPAVADGRSIATRVESTRGTIHRWRPKHRWGVLALLLLPPCILAAMTANPALWLILAATVMLVTLWPVERGRVP
jgi:hypothetical protein